MSTEGPFYEALEGHAGSVVGTQEAFGEPNMKRALPGPCAEFLVVPPKSFQLHPQVV